MPGFVLLVRPRGDADASMRLGITVSGKVGGAVVRNRMKRRFRELARFVLPQAGIAGADHILIGRSGGIEREWALLQAELEKALAKLKTKTGFPELVEGPSFSSGRGKKKGPSTSSGKPGEAPSKPGEGQGLPHA
jgi:ribonuclease P protein component